MKRHISFELLVRFATVLAFACGSTAVFGQAYMLSESDNWAFAYDGGDDFTDLFGWTNGLSQWDELGYDDGAGADPGSPGGVQVVSEDDVEFLRMVDTGDPRRDGFIEPSNRKIKFATKDPIFGGSALNLDVDGGGVGDGVTLYFRLRLTPGSVLNDLNILGDGSQWPADGRGLNDIQLGGAGFIGIDDIFDVEGCGGEPCPSGAVSFGLGYAENGNYDVDGLFMNNGNGGVAADLDVINGNTTGGGDKNILEITESLTEWQEFWITIDPLTDALQTDFNSTHEVNVWANGATDPATFHVNSGTWRVGGDSFADGANLHIGPAYTPDFSAHDLDFVYATDGLFSPEPFGGEDTCGDFDRDMDVDAADRTIQTVGWTGALASGGTATFTGGDCDGDGDVDTADLTGLVGNWTGAMAGNLADGDDADLVYDPATGNATIDASDTGSGMIISFVLGTDQNNMNTTESILPFIDAGTNTDNQPFQIGQTDPLNQGAGPLVDLGNILPSGLDLAGLEDYLTLAEYASELGQGGTLDLRIVPEPSSLILLMVGLIALLRRRR